MAEESAFLLFALTYLVFKHTLADFFLQTSYQYRNKGRYGHPGGLLHGLIHVALTVPVFLILPALSYVDTGLVLAGEFFVHYHVDWAKEQVVKFKDANSNDAIFWHAIGLDQLCHMLTYIAIVAFLISGYSPLA